MKEQMLEFLNTIGLAYWAEIVTDYPRCTYYFGPFYSKEDAEVAKNGYIDDLESEGAKGILVVIKRCKPSSLTVFDEKEEIKGFGRVPRLSGQAF